jgi:hypothetical protein
LLLIVVTSSEPGAGKTGVASAIARHFAYGGRPVQCARVAGADEGRASRDAAFYAGLAFAPGSPGEPVAGGHLPPAPGTSVTVCEADLDAAGGIPGATVVLVTRGAAPDALPEAVAPAVVVVTGATKAVLDGLPQGVGGARVFGIPEDRTLAGFSIEDARGLIHGEVLVEGVVDGETCDYLVVAPIGSDAGQPYFRRFQAAAVVARFDKTDMHLAALRAEPRCLILTGGRYPSDYVYDAAQASEVPVLLSPTDTENTVIALEGIWDSTRFQGERKLDRMSELLERAGLFAFLEGAVAG